MLQIIQNELALDIPAKVTLEDWTALAGQFRGAPDKLAWFLGDWINYGRKHFGEQADKIATQTGFSRGIRADAQRVAELFPAKQRRAELSWAHHKAVAALPLAKRNELLDRCEHEKLTQGELRELLGDGSKAKDGLDWEGIATPHAARVSFDRALRQTTERVPLDDWPVAVCRAWLRELEPIAALCDTLRDRCEDAPPTP